MVEILLGFGSVVVSIVIVLAALSYVLTRMSAPNTHEKDFLTSGFPGEQIIATHVVNACLKDAEPNKLTEMAFNAMGVSKTTDITFEIIRRLTGGMWVGGRVFLTSHRIIFMPNALNRAVHDELDVIVLRLQDVETVTVRFGLVTRIMDLKTAAGTLTLRLYATRRFAAAVEAARAVPV